MSTRKPGGHPARAAQAEDAREARRARAAAMRQRELARERSRRVLLISVAVVVVLVLVAVVAVVVDRSRGDEVAAGTGTPPGVTADDGGYVLPGTPAAGAPTLDIWLDYQCPVCKQFEDVSGEVYPQLAAEGRARVVVHTLSFLDANLGNDSSSRAAQGAAAAAAQGRFVEYTQEVFANQPEQEGEGYTDDQLEQFAKDAGVADTATWRRQLDDRTWQGFVERVQGAMSDQGVSGTPTVVLTAADGTKQNISQPTSGGGDGSLAQLLGADGARFLTDAVAAATRAS
ncbi:DsbA family protein [Kineococcus aurantiacus]|uniref:Protein-disulfide isomerase n=1 Tax=Kineococcus aurantiacus TaxID=37633 RepID=A0A7Y9DGX0_9ACTN|nr:thioredoxin domain-containing protein [Kineococcus aurantiacus]NYD20756.1 protein-disulfide isomerase [Kineococcus aurantiacus]